MINWLVVPVVAAGIGWVTNFIAVRMIFRPHREVRIAGLRIQGLLPKRRREFAENIGTTVQDHLVSPDDIKKVLDDPILRTELSRLVKVKLDEFIEQKVIARNPMLGMFLKGPFVDTLKEGLVAEFQSVFAAGGEVFGRHLDERLDLKTMVSEKIASFDMEQLEAIVLAVARRELFWIEILGAILGFVVGLVQVLLLKVLE